MYLIVTILLILFILLGLTHHWLSGGRQPAYREPDDARIRQSFAAQPEDEAPQKVVRAKVLDLGARVGAKLANKDTQGAREEFDRLSEGRTYPSEFRTTDANGVSAEWVLADGADSNRRLLYIHGGGFQFGSPKSHRTITSKFAEITGCAVLSIDYRMLPENRIADGISDCRSAYQWMLENGPHGPAPARQVYVAGDSAGGNLSLSLIAWVRDQKLRSPDAVVAMSPLTDATLSASSLRSNEATDITLKPLIAPLNRIPFVVRIWLLALLNRARPANPALSPLLGQLSDLPPTLLQASESEMLLDDSRRYFCKAYAAGSPVVLQTWANAVHVWQMFDPELPQARSAWREIEKFLAQHSKA